MGPDTISHIVLSFYDNMVAYAANRSLYIRSLKDHKELSYEFFTKPISSLYMDQKGDLILTQGGQVIKLLLKVTE